jgi:membrane-associated phospholipid phosphatase
MQARELSYKTIIFLLLFLIGFTPIQAQNQTDTTLKCGVNKSYIKSYWTDSKGLITSPIRWKKGEWIAAGAIIGTTAILFTQDEAIATYFRGLPEGNFEQANKYFYDPFGKMYYTIPLMGAFYIYGAAAHKTKPKVVAMDFVKASLYSGIIVTLIKHTAHRHRPYQTDPLNSHLWDGPITDNWNHTSFASGHTIMAFTFASVIGTHYKKTIWVPVLTYGLATLEGYSRMRADKHWASDVFVGAALGYAIGTFVVNQNHCKLQVTPIMSSNYTGLGFSYSFNQAPKSQLSYFSN